MTTDLEDSLGEALRNRASTVPHSPMPRLGSPRPARHGWVVPVAAAVVALAGVAGVAVALQSGAEPPAAPAASTAAKPAPGALAPGEVYYSREESGDGGTVIRRELWQSPQRTGPWQERVEGADVRGPAAGRCYPAAKPADEQCTRSGSWFNPTVDFLAKASRDPALIARQLHAEAVEEEQDRIDSGDFTESDETFSEANLAYLALTYLQGTLTANGMPADVEAALHQVVAHLPGVEVNPNAKNLHGERGTGYSLRDFKDRPLTVIFAGDKYIGSPTTAVEHGAAPGLGKAPSRMF